MIGRYAVLQIPEGISLVVVRSLADPLRLGCNECWTTLASGVQQLRYLFALVLSDLRGGVRVAQRRVDYRLQLDQ